MGYKVKKQQYKLVFADEDMHGLEIVVTKLPLRMVLRARELSAMGPEVAGSPATLREFIENAIKTRSIVSWNLEGDDNQPVPLTVEAFLDQDEDFTLKVISSWTLALGGVSAPLDDGSTSGDSALEASLPMDPLSPSPSS